MRRMTGAVLAAAAMACVQTAHADGLDPTEQRIVAEVRAHAPQALELLQQSVLINSGTMNARGVRDVGQLFRKQFDALSSQSKELASLVQKVSTDTAEPIKAGFNRALRAVA